MNAPSTVLDAASYWQAYYGDAFRFGQGTEHILDLLGRIPPVQRWTDLGSGSESLLWATSLNARRLTAVDADPDRLTTLTAFARAGRPRGIHQVALALCERTAPDAFTQRCRTLAATVVADLLAPDPPARHLVNALEADLLTQFGLLGLCQSAHHFINTFVRLHADLPQGGWTAGANWVAADPKGRVHLTSDLYQHTAHLTGLRLLHLDRVSSTDPQFPFVWIYLARRMSRCATP